MAFFVICQQLDVGCGVLRFKGKVIQSIHSSETDWIDKLVDSEQKNDEIVMVETESDNSALLVVIKGFEEYHFALKRFQNVPSFSVLDREYVRSLIDRIKGSRYHFEELLKDPNLLISLFKIQSDLENVLYIKSKSPYCYIHLENQKQPTIHRISIKLLQRYFHEDLLLKVQRSFLVNPKKVITIKRTGKDDVVMILNNRETLPVSRNLIPKIIEKFPGYLN